MKSLERKSLVKKCDNEKWVCYLPWEYQIRHSQTLGETRETHSLQFIVQRPFAAVSKLQSMCLVSDSKTQRAAVTHILLWNK